MHIVLFFFFLLNFPSKNYDNLLDIWDTQTQIHCVRRRLYRQATSNADLYHTR